MPLSKTDIEVVREEFKHDRGVWQDTSFARLYYRESQIDKIADRQRNNIVQFSSIAVAATAFASLIRTDSGDGLVLKIGIYLLYSASLLGIALSLDIQAKDHREIHKVMQDEQMFLRPLMKKAAELYNKSIDEKITREDIQAYFELRDRGNKDFRKTIKKQVTPIIDYTYYLFLLCLYFGITLTVFAALT